MNKYSNLPFNKKVMRQNTMNYEVSFDDIYLARKLGMLSDSKIRFSPETNIGFLISTYYPYYSVVFPINPEKINVTKNNNWVEIDRIGQHASTIIWTGTKNEKMDFDIYLDSYIIEFEDGLDRYLWKFEALSLPHNFKRNNDGSLQYTPTLYAPPRCVFCWGMDIDSNFREYDVYANINSIEKEFGKNLETIRAKISMTLVLVDINYSSRNHKNYVDLMEYVYTQGTIRQPFRT